MIYLLSFTFVPKDIEDSFRGTIKYTCYNTIYPFWILSKNEIEQIEFEPITIFYGGNGCGKTTALNVISEKLKLQRDTKFM